MLRVLVILNPVAGQGDPDNTRATIREHLDGVDAAWEMRETAGEGDALKWAKEAADFDLIVVAGGDGTVMEAMSGVIENSASQSPPLAQLPLGTANLLTRALAIPTDLEGALELAVPSAMRNDDDESGVIVEMDVGHLTSHNRYFAIVAGSGWDANLIDDASRELKNRLGFFAYVLTGIKNLFGLDSSKVTLEIDGETFHRRANSVMVINVGEIHGTGIAIGENVTPHDGKLDMAVASTRTLLDLLRVLWRILTRNFADSDQLRYFSAAHIKVDATPPLKLEIDGEVIGETPFEVNVMPNAARLVVPRRYAEAKKIDFSKIDIGG